MSESSRPTGRRIELEMRTSASPDRVWSAWTDPGKLTGWFPDRAHGEAKPGAELTWSWESFGFEQVSRVIEADRGERLALLTPGRDGTPLLLELTISVEGGRTKLRLVHSGFAEDSDWDEEYEGIVSGWRISLALLAEYLELYFGRDRRSFLVMRPTGAEIAALQPYFRQEAALTEWLTTSGSIGARGERYRLTLKDGGAMSGRVLEDTERELALACDEIEGVIELKAFSAAEQRVVGIRGSLWGADVEKAAEIERRMTEAVDRLAGALPVPS